MGKPINLIGIFCESLRLQKLRSEAELCHKQSLIDDEYESGRDLFTYRLKLQKELKWVWKTPQIFEIFICIFQSHERIPEKLLLEYAPESSARSVQILTRFVCQLCRN